MITVNVHEAKINLSRLLAQAEAGEDVVIARNGKPVARIVCVQKHGKRQFGSMKGQIKLDDSFFDPLPEEELAAWEGDCDCDYCSTPLP
jgi:prevent-host-death family protein